jgi:hypothetical protein
MKTIVASVLFALAFVAAPASRAELIFIEMHLSGPEESPPVASPGTGHALITINTTAHILDLEVDFQDLVGTTTVAHIHCCTAAPNAGTVGVATQTPTFFGFPAGVTAGSYDRTFDLLDAASYNPNFVTAQGGVAAAEQALIMGLVNGRAYLNIHTSFVGSGEIRSFADAVRIPEPGSLVLLASALVAALWVRRPRRAAPIV